MTARHSSQSLPLAALIAVLLLVACSSAQQSPSPSASTTRTPTLTATASPTPTVTPTATASPTPAAVPGVLPGPTATPVPLPNVAQLSASRDALWVLVGGERLFSSGDHGDTWQPRPLPPSLVNAEISFVDAREGWVASTGSPATQCQRQSFALWHTLDAGATWTPLPASGIDDARCKGSLSFVDASRGFVVAFDPNSPPVVYRTSDGGQTWSASAPLPDPPGFTSQPGGNTLQPGAVHAFGATLLLAMRPVGPPHVYRSTDGGSTWTHLATVPDAAGGFAIVSATRWIEIGAPALSRETLDAGASWHPFTTDYSQASPVTPVVVFGDADVGYATTRGLIQRTLDAGAHWSRIETPGTR